jgi:hypothetical protein
MRAEKQKEKRESQKSRSSLRQRKEKFMSSHRLNRQPEQLIAEKKKFHPRLIEQIPQ